MKSKPRRRVMNEVDKRPSNQHQKREWMILNKSHKKRSVDVGGKDVELYSTGATTYDKSLGRELKAKYEGDPDVMVIEKEYVQAKSDHKSFFTVPAMPWHNE